MASAENQSPRAMPVLAVAVVVTQKVLSAPVVIAMAQLQERPTRADRTRLVRAMLGLKTLVTRRYQIVTLLILVPRQLFMWCFLAACPIRTGFHVARTEQNSLTVLCLAVPA